MLCLWWYIKSNTDMILTETGGNKHRSFIHGLGTSGKCKNILIGQHPKHMLEWGNVLVSHKLTHLVSWRAFVDIIIQQYKSTHQGVTSIWNKGKKFEYATLRFDIFHVKLCSLDHNIIFITSCRMEVWKSSSDCYSGFDTTSRFELVWKCENWHNKILGRFR